MPLTARSRVSLVVTELAVFSIRDGRFILEEMAPGVALAMLRAKTGAEFEESASLGISNLAQISG